MFYILSLEATISNQIRLVIKLLMVESFCFSFNYLNRLFFTCSNLSTAQCYVDQQCINVTFTNIRKRFHTFNGIVLYSFVTKAQFWLMNFYFYDFLFFRLFDILAFYFIVRFENNFFMLLNIKSFTFTRKLCGLFGLLLSSLLFSHVR